MEIGKIEDIPDIKMLWIKILALESRVSQLEDIIRGYKEVKDDNNI